MTEEQILKELKVMPSLSLKLPLGDATGGALYIRNVKSICDEFDKLRDKLDQAGADKELVNALISKHIKDNLRVELITHVRKD